MNNLSVGLAFDDVLIRPAKSNIASRNGPQIDTSTRIATKALKLKIPLISSNMDTVTESNMAKEMALHGGIGIIHRFMSIDKQVNEVRLVKEVMRKIETNPPVVNASTTVEKVDKLLKNRKRGYVIVYDDAKYRGKFVGIATTRDLLAPPNIPVSKIMTLSKNIHKLNQNTNQKKAVAFMIKNKIEKAPVVDKKGNLIGMYTLSDWFFTQKHPNASLDSKGRLQVGAAIGVKKGDVDRALSLVEAGVDVLVLDIAHGHLFYSKNMLKTLKVTKKIKIPIIAGNVATKEGVKYLMDSGADGVKVGVGPGFVCETRDVAGVGVPQITAIQEAVSAVKNKRIPIIADGGIRKSGDVAKAIAAGADSVMIGSLLAGTSKSPGEFIRTNGQLKKSVRGMASASAFSDRQKLGDTTSSKEDYVPEGRQVLTNYSGETLLIIKELVGGLRSSMSYVGAHTINEMHKKAKFIQTTQSGATEQKRPLG